MTVDDDGGVDGFVNIDSAGDDGNADIDADGDGDVVANVDCDDANGEVFQSVIMKILNKLHC